MTSCTGTTGQTGTLYNYAQLQGLWINAGGSKALAPLAAAIAMAESGGCSAAVNPTDNNGTQTSWGLWQISDGTHNQPVNGILSPATNAQQAVAKYQNAGNFSPWGTYDSGAYKAFYSSSTTPDTNVPSSGGSSSSSSASDPTTCLIGGGEGGVFGVGALSFCLLNKSEARAIIGGLCVAAGLGVMGLGLAFVAAFALGRSGVAKTVVNLTPAGRVASAASGPAPRRRSAPGEDLTPDEVRTARGNRRKLAAARKPPPGREL